MSDIKSNNHGLDVFVIILTVIIVFIDKIVNENYIFIVVFKLTRNEFNKVRSVKTSNVEKH